MADAAALADLSGELGYPASTVEIKGRLETLFSSPNHKILVGEIDKVVGWVHIAMISSLESDPFAEMKGLVVTSPARGTGVGTQLVTEAERWAKQKGCRRMRVRMNVVRTETHDFYKKTGYTLTKRQEVFDKEI